jgi:hypothetical protein
LGEHAGPVSGINFSPDNKQIVTGGRTDKTVRIWSVKSAMDPEDEKPNVLSDEASASGSYNGTADASGALTIGDSHGTELNLNGLPEGYAPAIEYDTEHWIAIAPKRSGVPSAKRIDPDYLALQELQSVVLFRRGEYASPMAFLPAPAADWTSLIVSTDGYVVARNKDGHQYRWRYFADRGELSSFIKTHLPLDGTSVIKSRAFAFCLAGLDPGWSIGKCLNGDQPE